MMYQRARGPCCCALAEVFGNSIGVRSYNLPQTGVGLIGSLVGALPLGNGVLSVDEAG